MLYLDYRRVDGHPDYIISNIGEVWSIKFGKVILMKPSTVAGGYLGIILFKNGKRTFYAIHVLVGIHFIGLRTGTLTYDHIDTNNQNNRADNLRLATKCEQAENRKVRKDNKLGIKHITEAVNKSGNEYYTIGIKRNRKLVINKSFRKDKFNIEHVIEERDRILLLM